MTEGMEWTVRFELPSGGPGPDVVSSDELIEDRDAILVLLLREHHCRVSRSTVQAYSDAVDAFEDEDVAVVAALPDDTERAEFWCERYDLALPVLSDAAAEVDGPTADASATGEPAMPDGTPRFDAFADIETAVGTLPAIGVLDARTGSPRLIHSEGGRTLQDCPEPDEALETVRELLES